MLFIDRLDFFSFVKLLKSKDKKIHILNDHGFFASLLIKLLNFFDYKCVFETFFYGDIFSESGESMYIKTRKDASQMAFEYSEIVYDKLKKNYSKLKEDELILKSFISKRVFIELEYFLRRIHYLQYIKDCNEEDRLIICQPKFIESDFLQKKTKINIEFYGSNIYSIFREELKFFLIRLFSLLNYLFYNKKISRYHTKIGVATDPINLNTFERHYPHWVEEKNFKNFIIINDTNQDINISKEYLRDNNIKILGKSSLMYLSKTKSILNNSNSLGIKKHLLIQIKKLNMLSNGMLFLLKKYRCNKFVFTEPQDYISDAILMCKKSHMINTYCIQYANLGFRTPLMISPVDSHLCFSKYYESIFSWKNIKPKRFTRCGYTFSNNNVDPNMLSIKKKLNKVGVKKVLSFFDESIQHDKWGLISFDSIKKEYEALAKFIISKEDYAVIIKPQFMFNSLEIFNSKLITKAIKTKRFIEVKKGKHRNLITPQQVGSISDIAISNLIGGTAGIEAALAGASLFFINPSNFKPEFYDLINKKNLVFDNLDIVLKENLDDLKFKKLTRELLDKLISNDNKISDIIK